MMVAAIALLQLLRPAPRARATSQRARVVLEMPTNAMYPYSRDDDAYLWKHQNELEAAAEYLGRGVSSCESRLERLRKTRRESQRGWEGGSGREGGRWAVHGCPS